MGFFPKKWEKFLGQFRANANEQFIPLTFSDPMPVDVHKKFGKVNSIHKLTISYPYRSGSRRASTSTFQTCHWKFETHHNIFFHFVNENWFQFALRWCSCKEFKKIKFSLPQIAENVFIRAPFRHPICRRLLVLAKNSNSLLADFCKLDT